MKIEVFSVCKNEEELIPYYLKHYEKFADKITIYDNYSSDNSKSILEKHPLVEVKQFGNPNVFEEDDLVNIRNTCWKNSNADWIIVCDMDELVYANNIKERLSKSNYHVIKPYGLDIIKENTENCNLNILENDLIFRNNSGFCKPVIFNPKYISNITFSAGSHETDVIYKNGNFESIKISDEHRVSYDIIMFHLMFFNFDRFARRRVWQSIQTSCASSDYKIEIYSYEQWYEFAQNTLKNTINDIPNEVIFPTDFQWKTYLNLNLDLIDAGVRDEQSAIYHWYKHGHKEGRHYRL
jgi:hypothetical protein